MRRSTLWWLLGLIAVLAIGMVSAGCRRAAPRAVVPATVLYFVEREPGVEPYRTRLIVTADYLRIDDGSAPGDFLLYDRRSRVISSVVNADTRILVIPPKPVTIASPIELRHEVERDPARFPEIGGHPVKHYRLLTNGQLCYDLYAAEGLLPEATQALAEYRQALAGQQALIVPLAPAAQRDPCDLANHVFLPARHLAHGLPIRYTDMTGRTSELVDFKTGFEVDRGLFELPASFRRITIEELRGR